MTVINAAETKDRATTVVPSIAQKQGGVFTAAQAREEGWTARTVRRRIATKCWVYVAGRGLARPGRRWTAFQLAVAARLSLPDPVISHRTAAELHGFPLGEPEPVPECHVTMNTHRHTGHRIHAHLLRLTGAEIQPGPSGLRLTTPQRTALDCLAGLPFGPAMDLWAWVTTRRILDLQELQEAILARPKWHGTAQLRSIAGLVAGGAVSEAELRMHELLRKAGILGWMANAEVHDARGLIGVVDLLFEQARLIVEIDGWRSHGSHQAFVLDRRRGNRLKAAGYDVLNFTWDDLVERPAEVVAEVRALLNRRNQMVTH